MRFNGFRRCLQLRLLSDQTHPFPLERVLETASVGDLGQAIDHRHLAQGAIGLRQLCRFEIQALILFLNDLGLFTLSPQ